MIETCYYSVAKNGGGTIAGMAPRLLLARDRNRHGHFRDGN